MAIQIATVITNNTHAPPTAPSINGDNPFFGPVINLIKSFQIFFNQTLSSIVNCSIIRKYCPHSGHVYYVHTFNKRLITFLLIMFLPFMCFLS